MWFQQIYSSSQSKAHDATHRNHTQIFSISIAVWMLVVVVAAVETTMKRNCQLIFFEFVLAADVVLGTLTGTVPFHRFP